MFISLWLVSGINKMSQQLTLWKSSMKESSYDWVSVNISKKEVYKDTLL